jgi:hypothetical protein
VSSVVRLGGSAQSSYCGAIVLVHAKHRTSSHLRTRSIHIPLPGGDPVKTTTIRVDEDQLELLEWLAKHEGSTVADQIRTGISMLIETRAQKSDKDATEGNPPAFANKRRALVQDRRRQYEEIMRKKFGVSI